MSISSNNGVSIQTQASHEFLAASVAKSQQELEGQMALALIASVGASSPAAGGQSTNPNLGQNVNIKV
jgi:hypothetical protein